MKIEKPRLQFLESVRGLAAVAVVLYHSVLSFWPFAVFPDLQMWRTAPWPQRLLVRTPISAFYSGPFAVVIFFVLSGFVLSYSFHRSRRVESVTSAALRRYFRLALPVLMAVLLSFALLKHHLYHNVAAGTLSGSAWLRTWYGFKPFLGRWRPDGAIRQGLYGALFLGDASYDNALWTMSAELKGSFLVFAFLALFGNVADRWIIYGVLGGLLLALQNIDMLDFLLGAALCDAYVKFELRQRRFDLKWTAWPLLLVGIWLGSRRWLPTVPGIAEIVSGQCYSTLGAAVVIGVPLFSARLRGLLNVRPLALVGRVSFGLYLLHLLILCSAGSALYVRLRQASGYSSNSAGVMTVGFILAGSIAGGWIMYYVADLPSIALSKWIVATVFPPRPRPVALPPEGVS